MGQYYLKQNTGIMTFASTTYCSTRLRKLHSHPPTSGFLDTLKRLELLEIVFVSFNVSKGLGNSNTI